MIKKVVQGLKGLILFGFIGSIFGLTVGASASTTDSSVANSTENSADEVEEILTTPPNVDPSTVSQSTGTTVTAPKTVTIDPGLSSTGTVTDETANSSAASSTSASSSADTSSAASSSAPSASDFTSSSASSATSAASSAAASSSIASSSSSSSSSSQILSIYPDQDPEINDITVSGSVNNDMTGSGVLDNIDVTIDADNLNENNFLTPDGLHWSDETEVIPIKGEATGQLDNNNFGENGPTEAATTYTVNSGDGGRITNIGETLSGIPLDLIYTIISNDAANWQSTDPSDTTPHGIAFTGEQFIAGAEGNSIVALYYGMNELDILYQIVAHNTFMEIPVLASFITTDIDAAQGLQTNLANILTVTPNTTNLAKDGNLIYDASPDHPDLNGASDLPYGGYLGVGFVSHFDYHFYAPAPERSDVYPYSPGVRYDLFGSSLQAHLTTQVRIHGQIFSYDNQTGELKQVNNFIWWPNTPINIPASHLPGYDWGHMQWSGDAEHPVLNWYYDKLSKITVNFYGTNGVYLGSSSDVERFGTPYGFQVPGSIGYYDLASVGNYSGSFGYDDQVFNVYYNYNPPVVVHQDITYVNVPNPNYRNPYDDPNFLKLHMPGTNMTYGQYLSKSGMSTFGGGGPDGNTAWYMYYAYVTQPTIQQRVVKEYFTVDNTGLTPKPIEQWPGESGPVTWTVEPAPKEKQDTQNNPNWNWWLNEAKGQGAGYFAGKVGQNIGKGLGMATQAAGLLSPEFGAGFTFANELYNGNDIQDATGKAFASLGFGLMAAAFAAGIAVSAPASVGVAVGIGFITLAGIGLSAIYDKLYDTRKKKAKAK